MAFRATARLQTHARIMSDAAAKLKDLSTCEVRVLTCLSDSAFPVLSSLTRALRDQASFQVRDNS